MEEFLKGLWTKLAEFVTSYGLRLLAAVVVLIIGVKLIKFITEFSIGSKKQCIDVLVCSHPFLQGSPVIRDAAHDHVASQ